MKDIILALLKLFESPKSLIFNVAIVITLFIVYSAHHNEIVCYVLIFFAIVLILTLIEYFIQWISHLKYKHQKRMEVKEEKRRAKAYAIDVFNNLKEYYQYGLMYAVLVSKPSAEYANKLLFKDGKMLHILPSIKEKVNEYDERYQLIQEPVSYTQMGHSWYIDPNLLQKIEDEIKYRNLDIEQIEDFFTKPHAI